VLSDSSPQIHSRMDLFQDCYWNWAVSIHAYVHPATPPKLKFKIKITTSIRTYLVFEATSNCRQRYREITISIDPIVSENTLSQAFAKEGYHRCHAPKKPILTDLQKIWQLRFAQTKSFLGSVCLAPCLWTAECCIWLSERWGILHVTCIKNDAHHDDCLRYCFSKNSYHYLE